MRVHPGQRLGGHHQERRAQTAARRFGGFDREERRIVAGLGLKGIADDPAGIGLPIRSNGRAEPQLSRSATLPTPSLFLGPA